MRAALARASGLDEGEVAGHVPDSFPPAPDGCGNVIANVARFVALSCRP